MKFIPTNVHGFLDYVVGVFLILIPWVLDFPREENETLIPAFIGVGILAYSLATNYELGAAKVISMNAHLKLDYLSGAVLALSPWLLGFHRIMFLPHVVMGVIILIVTFFSKSHLSGERISTTRRKSSENHQTS